MIKSIIFDVDEVLVDSNISKYNFLKEACPEYNGLKYDDLAKVLPMSPELGGITGMIAYGFAEYGKSKYCYERPIFPGVIDTLKSLRSKGINLFTLSAAAKPEEKYKWLVELLGDYLQVEVSLFGESKEKYLRDILHKYNLNADETLFIDDMFNNLKSGIAVGLTVVRMQPYHYLPMPPNLAHVPIVHNLPELEKYIEKINRQ